MARFNNGPYRKPHSENLGESPAYTIYLREEPSPIEITFPMTILTSPINMKEDRPVKMTIELIRTGMMRSKQRTWEEQVKPDSSEVVGYRQCCVFPFVPIDEEGSSFLCPEITLRTPTEEDHHRAEVINCAEPKFIACELSRYSIIINVHCRNHKIVNILTTEGFLFAEDGYITRFPEKKMYGEWANLRKWKYARLSSLHTLEDLGEGEKVLVPQVQEQPRRTVKRASSRSEERTAKRRRTGDQQPDRRAPSREFRRGQGEMLLNQRFHVQKEEGSEEEPRNVERIRDNIEPTTDSIEPTTESTEATIKTPELITDSIKSSTDFIEPTMGFTEPTTESTELTMGATEQITGSALPITESAVPITESDEPTVGFTELTISDSAGSSSNNTEISSTCIAGKSFGMLNESLLTRLCALERLAKATVAAIKKIFEEQSQIQITNFCSFSRAVQELQHKLYKLSLKDQREHVAKIFAEEVEKVKNAIPIGQFQCTDGKKLHKCRKCGGRRHAVCELYSKKRHAQFLCQRCRPSALQRLKARDVFPADNQITKFIEKRIAESFPNVCVRVLFSGPKKVTVPEAMTNEYPNYPKEFEYVEKFIGVFEDHGDADVMVFAMQVQEYGEECPEPNTKKINVSYLDSVRYLTQDRLKTQLYNEILLGYVDYAEYRGYEFGHIWASPPEPDTDYLFPGRPSFQQVPHSTVLEEWYRSLLGHATVSLEHKRGRGRKAAISIKEKRKFVLTTGRDKRLLCRGVHEDGLLTRVPLFAGGFWEKKLSDILQKPKEEHQGEAEHALEKEGGESLFFFRLSPIGTFKKEEEEFVPFRLFSDRTKLLRHAEKKQWSCSTLQSAKYFTMKIMEEYEKFKATQ